MITDTSTQKDSTIVDSEPELMDKLVRQSPIPKIDSEELIEGPVLAKDKQAIYIDLSPFGTGLIFGREYLNARDIIKKVKVGDIVTAKIIKWEGEDGYIELSLKEAKQALVWNEAEKSTKNKETFELMIKDANKGGLLVNWKGMDGFVPASQLKPEHYPRVPDGDKDEILEELQKLVGHRLRLSIIGANQKENKLIFSEKTLNQGAKKEIVGKYELGDIITGKITGAVDFGIFVEIEEGLEGLIHISEISWNLVEDPKKMFEVGNEIKAKIIEIKDDKISLSIKALTNNPWEEAKKKYKKGDRVSGVVIKHNKHGALISIEEGVAGLVHISEFKDEMDLRQKLELGKTYNDFVINLFEPQDQKMTLIYNPDKKIDENS
ncbi:MAG: S1 RNA-binding domain-containing protein [Patescibacteria group bacterium]